MPKRYPSGAALRAGHHGLRRSAVAKDAVASRAHADGECPGQHRGLTERGDLDAWRIREPGCEVRPDRLEEEVAVGPQAASEDDELDVCDRADRHHVQCDPTRLLRDDLASER